MQIRCAAEILRQAHAAHLKSDPTWHSSCGMRCSVRTPTVCGSWDLRRVRTEISPLVGSRHLDQPMWLFDFAMLAFQVGQYAEGTDAFSRLRKGQRFFEVLCDRGCSLT